MTVTKSGKFLLLLFLYFQTPILVSSREICQGWVLTTEDDYFYLERRDVLGKYLHVKDSDETTQQIYHREEFKNEGGFTLWYDTTPQWSVYENKFTTPLMTNLPNGTAIVDQRPWVIQTRCNEPLLDDCKTFNFTYSRGNREVVDSTMTLTCLDIGPGTQEESSFMSIGVGYIIVIVISVCFVIVSVMFVIIIAVFPNKNKSYTAVDRNEPIAMEDLQHQNCELEKRYEEATRMCTDANKKALSLASQLWQLSGAVQAIDVEEGLLQITVHHVENETQVCKALPIKSCEESIEDGINVKGTEAINVSTTGVQNPVHGLEMGGSQPAPQHETQPTVLVQRPELLTLSMLAAAPPPEKKKMLGEVVPASRNDTGIQNISSGLPIAPNMHNPSSGSLPSSQKVNGDRREPLPLLFVDLPTSGQSKISPASPKVAELKKNFE